MGHIAITGFDDVLKMLDKLSNKGKVDEIAKKAVDAALPILEGSVRSHIHPHEAAGGVTEKKAKVNSYGVFGVATVTGRDRYGASYAKIANVLEYGRHDGKGPHKPWRSASASSAEGPCKQIIEDIVKIEMGAE